MNRSRAVFWAAALVFVVFVADILVAKVQISGGNSIPLHLPEWMQFLVLLLAVGLFVVGTLICERREADDESADASDRDAGSTSDDGRPDAGALK